MGSPLVPVLVNLVMGSPLAPVLVNLVISPDFNGLIPSFDKFYADEIFAAFNSNIKGNTFFTYLNVIDVNKEFTIKTDVNKVLPIEDALITKMWKYNIF